MDMYPVSGYRLLSYAGNQVAAPSVPYPAYAPAPFAWSPPPVAVVPVYAQPTAWQTAYASWLASYNQLVALYNYYIAQLYAAPVYTALNPQPAPVQPAPTQPSPHPQPAPPANPGGAARFNVSTFNILGSSHTAKNGDKAAWRSGVARMPEQIALLRQKNISVVGFQEMNTDQAKAFKQQAGSEYGIYPGPTKSWRDSLNSIAWRKSEWDLVKGEEKMVPSFQGDKRPFSIVTLKNKQTGKNVVVINCHNAPGHDNANQQKWRDQATAIQAQMVNQLRHTTGLPVIVVGDMNETTGVYNRMTREAGMHSSTQGPKGQAPKGMRIEWIFGTNDVKFNHSSRDSVTKKKQISDHDFVWSGVTV